MPIQPLAFVNKEGTISRYNLRKVAQLHHSKYVCLLIHFFFFVSTQFGEMPYHLVRSRRFQDLYEHVLFNYEWLHAKLSSCPLQAVLADFEDASTNTDDLESKRELMLVADALRLGGAILAVYPNMLAPQLVGRVSLLFLNRNSDQQKKIYKTK